MNKWTLFLILIILGLIFTALWLPIPYFSTGQAPTHQTEIRAAIDIGSGATNIKVAEVDKNTDKIVTQIFEKSIPVPYQKHLEASGNNTFDAQVMQQGVAAIKSLREMALQHQAKKVVAVATAAFRKASNAPEFAKEIEKQTGIRVHIIDQDEEGVLAFRGALANSPIEEHHAVVWDIGGGSMQLTTLTDTGSFIVEKGKTASIPYKNALIEKIKGKDSSIVHSPNPMTLEDIQKGLQIAKDFAEQTSPFIKEKILNQDTQVLAVGSLFNYGIKPMIEDRNILTGSELKDAIDELIGKTDAELPGGSLAEVAISNPLLVLGYMNALHIRDVDILSVNNADGALTNPPYWKD